MIFGTGNIQFKFVQNGNIATYTPNLSSTDFQYNIPDILIQNSINGHKIQIVKGYYHRFVVTIYNFTENDYEMIESSQWFLPHYDNTSNEFEINKISQPYYHNDINGFNLLTVTIETKVYQDLAVISE
jgi:hypothetical protein